MSRISLWLSERMRIDRQMFRADYWIRGECGELDVKDDLGWILPILGSISEKLSAIFYSRLIYGCNICGLTSEENLKKIEILQKRCIRIMTFSYSRSYTNPLFIKLKVLKVCEIIKLQQ